MKRMRITSLLAMNLFYWLFCIGQYFLAKAWLKQIQGISVLFIFMSIGFWVVSLFDSVCHRIFEPDTLKESSSIAHIA